jgi:DNA polymerase-1
MGARGLQSSLYVNSGGKVTITRQEAEQILQDFKSSYPSVDRWCERVTQFAVQNRYIELWTGRKRHYPARSAHYNHNGQDMAVTAVNNLVQGGAAEVLRHDICRLDRMADTMRWPLWMHLQIHDDVLMSLPEDDYERYLPYIFFEMTNWSFKVPIGAELKVGKVWTKKEMRTVEVEGRDYRVDG